MTHFMHSFHTSSPLLAYYQSKFLNDRFPHITAICAKYIPALETVFWTRFDNYLIFMFFYDCHHSSPLSQHRLAYWATHATIKTFRSAARADVLLDVDPGQSILPAPGRKLFNMVDFVGHYDPFY